jgi:hypothetical protein
MIEVPVMVWGSGGHESCHMRRDFDRIVTFCSGIFKNDVAENRPWLVGIRTAVTLEKDAEVGISCAVNVWDNVVVDGRLVIAASPQANESSPSGILAVDELYDVL